jgi:hypothetical protein
LPHVAAGWIHPDFYTIFEADWLSHTAKTKVSYKNGDDAGKLIMQGREILGLYFQNPVEHVEATDVPFTVPPPTRRTGTGYPSRSKGSSTTSARYLQNPRRAGPDRW